MTLNELFKNTTYDDTLFSVEAKSTIESRIFMKSVRGSEVPYITCAIRDKEIKLTPEEAVRQLYIYKLMNDYGYAASRIQLEAPIHFGREVKRADITIMDKDRPMVPYIIVELKKPKLTDGKEQLKSYCNATGAPIGVWTNGEQISCYNRKDPNFFEEISDIPKATQKLSDIINEKFTYEDLKRKDKISTQKTSLRALIKEMEDEVLAGAGVDSFEEIFKLIFTKLYDVLKQVVDQNIWRLKQLKLLPSASQAAAEKDYNREPPPDIDWPTDEEAKFTWFYYEMLKLNKDGARVLLKGKIDFTEHHYETECTVRWNESLSETAIKNASITRVVESQEKELAAAI